MSAPGPLQTWVLQRAMSAFGGKAEMPSGLADVRF